jgi:hypothetical protein
MAWKDKMQEKTSFRDSAKFEFINFTLPKADEKAMKAWMEAGKLTGEKALEEIVLLGYKVSCVVDTENECFVLTVIGTAQTPNNQKGLSSRSDSLMTCAIIALYKITQVFEGGIWSNPHKNPMNWG